MRNAYTILFEESEDKGSFTKQAIWGDNIAIVLKGTGYEGELCRQVGAEKPLPQPGVSVNIRRFVNCVMLRSRRLVRQGNISIRGICCLWANGVFIHSFIGLGYSCRTLCATNTRFFTGLRVM
jgi:hypothetical protein